MCLKRLPQENFAVCRSVEMDNWQCESFLYNYLCKFGTDGIMVCKRDMAVKSQAQISYDCCHLKIHPQVIPSQAADWSRSYITTSLYTADWSRNCFGYLGCFNVNGRSYAQDICACSQIQWAIFTFMNLLFQF